MKKMIFSLVLVLIAIQGKAQAASGSWVFLQKVEQTDVLSLTFTDLMTSLYQNYVFVIDLVEPYGGYADAILQVSTDNGVTWSSANYPGGLHFYKNASNGMTQLISYQTPSLGIPLTDYRDGAFIFSGILYAQNAVGSFGFASIFGNGVINGADSTQSHATVSGSNYGAPKFNAIRFVTSNGTTHFSRISVSVYGLVQQ
jgi:hypothetical protein